MRGRCKHQVVVLDVLESLVRDGTTVIITIHDPNLAFCISDEFVVLDAGQVAVRGGAGGDHQRRHPRVYGIECDLLPVASRLPYLGHFVIGSAVEYQDEMARPAATDCGARGRSGSGS